MLLRDGEESLIGVLVKVAKREVAVAKPNAGVDKDKGGGAPIPRGLWGMGEMVGGMVLVPVCLMGWWWDTIVKSAL